MVAERVGRPVLQEVHERPDRPVGRAAAAMTSSEVSGTIIPSQGSVGIQEEQVNTNDNNIEDNDIKAR